MTLIHMIAGLQTGGIETWLTRVIPELDRRGHRNVFIVTKPSNVDDSIVQKLKDANAEIHGIPGYNLPALYRFLRKVKQASENQGEKTAVVNHLQATSIVGALPAKALGLPTFLIFHNVTFRAQSDLARKRGLSSLRDAFVNMTVPVSVRLADECGGCSADVVDQWAAKAKSKTVIRYCVDDAFLEDSPTDTAHQENGSAPRLINIGRLVEQKDQESLLKMFDIFAESVPEAELLILGEGTLRPKLESQIAGMKHGAAVKMPGVRRDVKEQLDASTLLVMTSKWEGYGLVCLEAASRGIPTVAFRVAGIRDAVRDGETGILIEPGNIEQMAEACRTLCTDRELYNKFSRAAREHAFQNGSPAASADLLLDVLNGQQTHPQPVQEAS